MIDGIELFDARFFRSSPLKSDPLGGLCGLGFRVRIVMFARSLLDKTLR